MTDSSALNHSSAGAVGKPFDLGEALAQLGGTRPVFHSEADFQHALAVAIHRAVPRLNVRLEVPQSNGTTVDMLIIEPSSNDRFAIELKYKTASWTGVSDGEMFRLKNHGADDLGGYDVLKDMERVESLISGGSVNGGAVAFITNEPLYWRPRRPSSRVTNADEFRVHEGLTITGVRSWGPQTGGSSKGREDSIKLRGSYPMAWQDYSNLGGERGVFRQLVLNIH